MSHYQFRVDVPAGSKYPQASLDVVDAIYRVSRGQGNAVDAKRMYDWIMIQAAGLFDSSLAAGTPDVTAFNEGRRFVALLLNDIVSAPESKLNEMRNPKQESKP